RPAVNESQAEQESNEQSVSLDWRASKGLERPDDQREEAERESRSDEKGRAMGHLYRTRPEGS
ncbi:hypothetical protein Asppvi_008063, partial [Aspergillus pseudoviridinutans]